MTIAVQFNNNNVVFIDKDYSCLEYSELVKSFDYVIASRYHSIIHAFKNNIPCLSLGWATKYQELMVKFGQSAYAFDVRNNLPRESLLFALESLDERQTEEQKTIQNYISIFQETNIFDVLSF